MPLRLIGRFDQRWRDTPVKNQQPPVPPLSLCIPLFLYPSFSLSVALSFCLLSFYPFLSHLSYLLSTSSVSSPPPLSFQLSASLSCKRTHIGGSEQPSCFHRAPPHSSSPCGCSVMPTGGSSTGQMAHSAPRHPSYP